MADVTTLVIDRSKWLRGETGSVLLRPHDGKMCCLGFYGLACGVPVSLLRHNRRPDDFDAALGEWPSWLVTRTPVGRIDYRSPSCTQDSVDLMVTNDDKRLLAAEREQKVAAIFAKHGVEVRFVDGTAQPPAGPQGVP